MNKRKVFKLSVLGVFVIAVLTALYFYLPNILGDTVYPLKYPAIIAKYSKQYDVDPALVAAVILQESRFNPEAQSPKGATGLMQFMPGTAATVAREIGLAKFDLRDPETSINLGVRHIKDLLIKYNGNLDAALAGYNAGTGNADKWIALGLMDNIPFSETNNYVKKVKNYRTVYSTIYATELGLKSTVELQPAKKDQEMAKVRGFVWDKIFDDVFNLFDTNK